MPRVRKQATTKPARGPNTTAWDRPAIIAALSRKGWSLRRLSLANHYSAKSLGFALRAPWLHAEQIIAAAIGGGVRPEEIWPDRYRARAALAERRARKESARDQVGA
ncbi:MAG: helix-turn-helix domain-containing protein [Candidatus Binatus sp.]|uniref:helix-turn-helix domain-containing protein n=1 Tax=Candidatus Binatus sp. TaxID=2811406 RepID=UPI003C77D89A